MRRDFALYELSDDEFEALIVRICSYWLGEGVTPFAPGPDGGRDGKFFGTASRFPSDKAPLSGHFVLQAKHVSSPDKSCSENDFKRLLKKEFPKIKRLMKAGLCDHYILFTNRKYTGRADEKLITELVNLGLTSAHIIGVERLHLALDCHADIRNSLPNHLDASPFRVLPDDLVEVIDALHQYASDDDPSAFLSALDFEKLKILEKNKINGVSSQYYQQIIVDRSMSYFPIIDQFLRNPRNKSYLELYHDTSDDLKEQILINRDKFDTFDRIFSFLCREIQANSPMLKGRRRLVSIVLHYMYCNCDIGSKDLTAAEGLVDAHA